MVVKSDENAKHDGRIISGPLRNRQPGVVYQRLVDNREGGHFAWLRPVILGGRIVLTYHKTNPPDDRFSFDAPPHTRLADPDAFSQEETDAILEFAARIGLDYGEMDVLRDTDGAIYVVDVNKTPMWPGNMDEAERDHAVRRMAAAFSHLIYEHNDADDK
jgi:glutathione synthase/RimK-type ligase-like ATP-grasp enzyme